MADFFTCVEIIKYFDLNKDALIYEAPFTYSTKVSTQDLSASYFIDTYEAEDVTNKEVLNIQGIIIDYSAFYTQQFSLNDCISNEKSFYFDAENQILYIHFDHDINPVAVGVEYGKTFGYTNDKVREFNGVPYLPDVISIPKFNKKVDPLQYKKMGMNNGNVVLNNRPQDPDNNGPFDGFDPIYGNELNVLCGEDGDSYSDLKQINKQYIEDYKIDFNTNTLITKDKREQLSKKIPTALFSTDDDADIDDDLIGQVKPDAYGYLRGVPGICINGKAAGAKTFYFASTITGTPTVYAKKNEKWSTVVPTSIDNANGTVTLAVADAHVDGNAANGLNEIKATGTFVNYSNPADIIVDLNSRYLDIDYNTSNYNTTEWADESQYLQDVGLYMPDQKDIFKWIELLQNGSTVGFQYFIDYGRITMRLDNPNRDPVLTIDSVDILNNDNIPTDFNADLYATSAVVFYDKDYSDDITLRYENTDYYIDVFKEHRKDYQFKVESLLWVPGDAVNKSTIIMEDQSTVRPIWKIIIKDIDYFDLRIFDIINAYLSYPGEFAGFDEVDHYTAIDTGMDGFTVTDDNTGVDHYTAVDYTKEEIRINAREYFGLQRCQIIGINPNFDNGEIELTIRQRAFSQEFEDITGYTP